MKEFKENDDEIEEMAQKIAASLESLKDKTKKTGEAIHAQGELLDEANAKAENTEQTLRLQNNELKRLLNKYRNGKQLVLDAILTAILIGPVSYTHLTLPTIYSV